MTHCNPYMLREAFWFAACLAVAPFVFLLLVTHRLISTKVIGEKEWKNRAMNWIKWLKKWLSPTYRYRKRVEELQKELNKKNQKISELQTKLDRWVRGDLDITVNSTDFSTVREDVANNLDIPEKNVQVLDRKMEYVSVQDAKKIVEEDLTDTVKYIRDNDEFVCNHFAGLFAALVKTEVQSRRSNANRLRRPPRLQPVVLP